MAEETIFTKILNGEIPSSEVYSDEEFYAFRDINPAAPTHILLIPRKPIPRFSAIVEEDEGLMGRMMLTAKKVAAQEGLEDYRLVFNNGPGAGMEVYHLHLHILGGRQMSWPPG